MVDSEGVSGREWEQAGMCPCSLSVSERRRDIAGEKCSCLGRENEKEKKLNAKYPQSFRNTQSAIPKSPCFHRFPEIPHSTAQTAQTLALRFTLK